MLKLALFVLNARANDDEHPGECWASIETLTLDAGVRSPRSLQYALRELERLGCVERREPGWKGRAAATYIIRIGQLQAIAAPVDEKVKSRQRSAELEQLDELDAQELEPPSAPDAPAAEAPAPASAARELEPSTARDSDTWTIWLALYRSGLRVRWGDDAEYPVDRVSNVLREQLVSRTVGLARKYARNNETLAESVARCTGRLLVHFFRRDRKPLLERHHPLEWIDGDIDVIFADVGRELKASTPEDLRFAEVQVFTPEQLAAVGKARRDPVRRTMGTRMSCAEVIADMERRQAAALAPTGTGER